MNREENAPFMYDAQAIKHTEIAPDPDINRTRLWACALCLSAVLVLLGFDTLFGDVLAGINVPVAVLACYAGICMYDKPAFARMFCRKNLIYFLIVLFSSLTFIYTDNDMLLALNACVCVLTLALHIALGFGINAGDSPVGTAFVTAFVYPLEHIGRAAKFVFGKSTNKGIFTGCILGGAMLVFISVLLAGADKDFSMLIANFFGGNVTEIASKIVCVIAGFFLICSLFYSLAQPTLRNKSAAKRTPINTLSVTIVGYFTAFPIVLFASIRLFSAGDNGYATAAREGFFELTFVAAFVFAFVLFAVKTCPLTKNLKAVLLLLHGGIILLLYTAFSRMVEYEQAFGFTRLRIYTQALMIMLFIFVILCTLRIFTRKFNLVRSLLLFGVCALLFLTYFKPDAYIARQNVEMGNTDYSYLASLSLDAYPYYAGNIETSEADNWFAYINKLESETRLENSKDPRSFNLSRMQAMNARSEQ